MDREEILSAIEEVIAPYIGKTMAGASTRVQCEKLGLHEDTLTPDQYEALVFLIAKALRVFVGSAKTDEIVTKIRRKLG